MQINPREPVILAKDFSKLVDWYRDALGFEVRSLFEQDYHYCNLETPTGIRIGIAPAEEVEATIEPASNSVLLQVAVDNVEEFFKRIEQAGGSIAFGPSFDKAGNFWFGGIKDPEGNPIWVVDMNCP